MLFVEDATYVPNGIGDSHLLIRSHFILYFASSCEANPQPIAAERHSDAANNPQHPSNRYNPIAKKNCLFLLEYPKSVSPMFGIDGVTVQSKKSRVFLGIF
jgi:hypothetical protein